MKCGQEAPVEDCYHFCQQPPHIGTVMVNPEDGDSEIVFLGELSGVVVCAGEWFAVGPRSVWWIEVPIVVAFQQLARGAK